MNWLTKLHLTAGKVGIIAATLADGYNAGRAVVRNAMAAEKLAAEVAEREKAGY